MARFRVNAWVTVFILGALRITQMAAALPISRTAQIAAYTAGRNT